MDEIFILQNGEKLGPYSLDEVRSELSTGNFSKLDLAWFNGGPGYLSIAELLGIQTRTIPLQDNGKKLQSTITDAILKAVLILILIGAIAVFIFWCAGNLQNVGKANEAAQSQLQK